MSSFTSSSDNPSPPSPSRLRSSTLPASQVQCLTRLQSQENDDVAIRPPKVPQSPTRSLFVPPSIPRRSTESTVHRMSFSASSLNPFSLHRTKSNAKSLSQPEQPPPLPTNTPSKTSRKRKTLEVKAATGNLKGVHRRASGIERKVSTSMKHTSTTPSCTPPLTPTRLTHSTPSTSQIQSQVPAQILDDPETPLPQHVAPSQVLKQKRSFFRRMADRLTRSRTGLRDAYKDKDDSGHNLEDHPITQREVEMIDDVIGVSPRSRQITPSPSSASLRPSNHLPTPQSSALPSPSLRSRPPSPHPPPTHALPPTPTPTHALPPTPISNTISHPWDTLPLGSPPTDNESELPPTPTSTRSRKSRPPAIKVPGTGTKQDSVLAVGDEENGVKSLNKLVIPPQLSTIPRPPSVKSASFTHDAKATSPTSLIHSPSPRLPPSPDTRAPLLMFPLPPKSPTGSMPSPRTSVMHSARSFTSPPTAFSTPGTTPKKASSAYPDLPSVGQSYVSQRKPGGGEVTEKSAHTPRRRSESLAASFDELVTIEKEAFPKVRDRAATIGGRELRKDGRRLRADSHARADSHTLAGFDLQMQLQAVTVQAAISSPAPWTAERARARRGIEHHLAALAAEQELLGLCRADSPTIPLPELNSLHPSVEPASGSASIPPSSNGTVLEGRSRIESQSGYSGTVNEGVNGLIVPNSFPGPSVIEGSGSPVHAVSHPSSSRDDRRAKVDRWLAESPTDVTLQSSTDQTSLDVWKEALFREGEDDDHVMPEVERMALEMEERARQTRDKEQSMAQEKNEPAKSKKKRGLFRRKDKRDTSPVPSLQHLPRLLAPSPAPSCQPVPRSPTSPSTPGPPRMHTQGSLLLQTKDIADPESRRISEMVFLH